MAKYILSIDQGTTGTTSVIVNKAGEILGKANHEFQQIYPKDDWVEHNPEDIWNSVKNSVLDCIKKANIKSSEIHSIGITNQRETCLLWDKKSGKSLYNAIVWQCKRTQEDCVSLQQKAGANELVKRTGLCLDPYFSGTKLRWLLNETKVEKIENVLAGTIDTFLTYRLTGGGAHFTEPSNASRTLLYNLSTGQWDSELLTLFDIPKSILPKILDSNACFGVTKGLDFLPDGIPINGILGDQQAALFGQMCFEKGNLKCTYGTGSFIMVNTDDEIQKSSHGLLSTVAWRINNRTKFALEGSAFIAGAAVQWLRDGLKIIKDSSEVEALAQKVSNNGGVCFVPALTGLGTPYWEPNAKGLISGITRSTTQAHIARACLEGIALQNTDIITTMQKETETKIPFLRVDGGASINNFLMQLQANLLNIEIQRSKNLESTALGAAFMSGLGSQFWKDLDEIKSLELSTTQFKPNISQNEREELKKLWKINIQRTTLLA